MRKAESSVVAVIPARWASTRFPGKPMAELAGEPMIAHVVRRASEATTVDHVIVATDDERIAEAAIAAGAEAVMTGECPSGTDRVAAAVAQSRRVGNRGQRSGRRTTSLRRQYRCARRRSPGRRRSRDVDLMPASRGGARRRSECGQGGPGFAGPGTLFLAFADSLSEAP